MWLSDTVFMNCADFEFGASVNFAISTEMCSTRANVSLLFGVCNYKINFSILLL